MISVYTKERTPRIEYIFDLMLSQLLGLKFEFVNDVDEFLAIKGHKLCYTDIEIDGFFVRSSKLLFESGIRDFSVNYDFDNEHFLLDDEQFFDPFAAAFYLVSRYEEYLPFTEDDHGRFPATESVLYHYQVLKKPLVNEWAIELKRQLTDFYPNLLVSPRKYEFRSTIDVDQAFKYEHKGWKRNLGGLLRDIKNGDWSLVSERLAVVKGRKADPFNNFQWQQEIHKEKGTRVNYFIQVGDHGEFDKNILHDNPDFVAIIKSLSKHHEVGIHPSYASNADSAKVANEKKRLEKITGLKTSLSRQHFLVLKFPETFQNLIELGIEEEHSLGYSTHLGYRAGIAAPFGFFDLSKNTSTELTFIPFCMMDITPLHYNEQSPEEAKIELTQMIGRLKKVGGLCVSLWHNESFSENGRWEGWRTVYEHLLNQ